MLAIHFPELLQRHRGPELHALTGMGKEIAQELSSVTSDRFYGLYQVAMSDAPSQQRALLPHIFRFNQTSSFTNLDVFMLTAIIQLSGSLATGSPELAESMRSLRHDFLVHTFNHAMAWLRTPIDFAIVLNCSKFYSYLCSNFYKSFYSMLTGILRILFSNRITMSEGLTLYANALQTYRESPHLTLDSIASLTHALTHVTELPDEPAAAKGHEIGDTLLACLTEKKAISEPGNHTLNQEFIKALEHGFNFMTGPVGHGLRRHHPETANTFYQHLLNHALSLLESQTFSQRSFILGAAAIPPSLITAVAATLTMCGRESIIDIAPFLRRSVTLSFRAYAYWENFSDLFQPGAPEPPKQVVVDTILAQPDAELLDAIQAQYGFLSFVQFFRQALIHCFNTNRYDDYLRLFDLVCMVARDRFQAPSEKTCKLLKAIKQESFLKPMHMAAQLDHPVNLDVHLQAMEAWFTEHHQLDRAAHTHQLLQESNHMIEASLLQVDLYEDTGESYDFS